MQAQRLASRRHRFQPWLSLSSSPALADLLSLVLHRLQPRLSLSRVESLCIFGGLLGGLGGPGALASEAKDLVVEGKQRRPIAHADDCDAHLLCVCLCVFLGVGFGFWIWSFGVLQRERERPA